MFLLLNPNREYSHESQHNVQLASKTTRYHRSTERLRLCLHLFFPLIAGFLRSPCRCSIAVVILIPAKVYIYISRPILLELQQCCDELPAAPSGSLSSDLCRLVLNPPLLPLRLPSSRISTNCSSNREASSHLSSSAALEMPTKPRRWPSLKQSSSRAASLTRVARKISSSAS